jgi:hypothetical protein
LIIVGLLYAWESRAGAATETREAISTIITRPDILIQRVLVLALTPALTAGLIADERRRKTLHCLRASHLTSPDQNLTP